MPELGEPEPVLRDMAQPVMPAAHTHGALVRFMQRRKRYGVFTIPPPIRRLHVPDPASEFPVEEHWAWDEEAARRG